jgi:hypothetical protein
MKVGRGAIVVLGELLKAYYQPKDIIELADLFEVDTGQSEWELSWLAVSRSLIERINFGNNREFLDALIDQIEIRNTAALVTNGWEERQFHDVLKKKLRSLRESLGDPAIPHELAVPEGKSFAAKSQVREMLEGAETPILIVDPYVGVGTLDCLRLVSVAVRLLTGKQTNSLEVGFDRALGDFQTEGRAMEVRRHPKLHDRHLIFNDRLWLVGSSLKDAGRKPFHCIEVVDAKAVVVAALEEKWAEAEALA